MFGRKIGKQKIYISAINGPSLPPKPLKNRRRAFCVRCKAWLGSATLQKRPRRTNFKLKKSGAYDLVSQRILPNEIDTLVLNIVSVTLYVNNR